MDLHAEIRDVDGAICRPSLGQRRQQVLARFRRLACGFVYAILGALAAYVAVTLATAPRKPTEAAAI
jgi:hypothetical protein